MNWLGLVGWSLLLPSLADAMSRPLSLIPLEWLAIPSVEFLAGCACGVVLLGFPHYATAALLRGSLHAASKMPARPAASSLWGVAAGLSVWPSVVLPQWDVLSLSGVAAILGGFAGVVLLRRNGAAAPSSAGRASAAPAAEDHWLPMRLAVACLAGGLLSIAVRVQSQLWLEGLYSLFAVMAGFLFGVCAAQAQGGLAQRWIPTGPSRLLLASVVCALAAATGLGGFGGLVDVSLWMNAHVSSAAVLIGLRAALCATFALPAGMAFGLVRVASTSSRGRRGSTDAIMALTTVAGAVIGRWSLPSIEAACHAVLAVAAVAAVASVLRGPLPQVRTWRMAMGLGGAAGLCVLGIMRRDTCDVSRSARLLFSTQTALAAQTSDESHLLPALDDARLVDCREGRQSAWTVWKQRGELLVLRENGVPAGGVSLDGGIAPQVPSEVLAAAMPLAAHARPDRVLVVGLGSSTTVATCLEFPVRSVTCVEQDADLLDLLGDHLRHGRMNPLDDERLTLRTAAPGLASASLRSERFDVIVINVSQPASSHALGTTTAEAYRRWSDCLADGGILCQRLDFVDLGAEPVRNMARTLATVFPQVVLWESAPGELLFLASRSSQPIVNESLLTRMELPHVRRVLADIGWDWSVPLSLMAVRPEHLPDLISKTGRANTAASARLACRMPAEVARWGSKWQEVRELLQPHVTPLMTWLPPSPELEALHKRLADVAEQRTIINAHPEHYAAYRKSLRERLQERPRSKIVQLKHEGLQRELDPEDERRKEYLIALGSAATPETPSLEALQHMTQFAAPYDPLVAPFLPGEMARLYARSGPHEASVELRHWLRSVYYAPSFDRSVRGAAAALDLLVRDESAVPDPAERWDHANALLEVLKQRWIARSQTSVGSLYDPIDARETIDAANRAIEMLQATADDAGIDAQWCAARCQVLERTLVRPLRTHQAKQTARIKALDEKRTAATDQAISPH